MDENNHQSNISCFKCENVLNHHQDKYGQNFYFCKECNELIPNYDWHPIFQHYLRQEKLMMNIFDYIPFIDNHRKVHSPKLFDIYLQIGTGIEQILKYISIWRGFDELSNIEKIRRRKATTINIRHYLSTLDPCFNFKNQYILMNYPQEIIQPFDNINLEDKQASPWPEFQIYSKYKHNWTLMIRETTLEATIRMLGAYFILICINPLEGNHEYLFNKGILNIDTTQFVRIMDHETGYVVDSSHSDAKEILQRIHSYYIRNIRSQKYPLPPTHFSTDLFSYHMPWQFDLNHAREKMEYQ